jgi:lipopolysaccharide export system protein LptC
MSSHTEQHASPIRRTVPTGAASRLVGLLAVACGLGLLGMFVWQAGVLAPSAPQDVASSDVIEKTDQITSENAAIAGRDKNNRPYEIRARSGEQDKAVTSLVHMNDVASVFERPSGAKLDVKSNTGLFDRKTKALALSGNVVFSEGNRFRALMEKAEVNTEDQSLTSQSPVKVDMQGTMIEADSLTVTENGSRIIFKGGVRARFITGQKTTGDGQ